MAAFKSHQRRRKKKIAVEATLLVLMRLEWTELQFYQFCEWAALSQELLRGRTKSNCSVLNVSSTDFQGRRRNDLPNPKCSLRDFASWLTEGAVDEILCDSVACVSFSHESLSGSEEAEQDSFLKPSHHPRATHSTAYTVAKWMRFVTHSVPWQEHYVKWQRALGAKRK